jgi:GNAT superfamily N-acetyltransferase
MREPFTIREAEAGDVDQWASLWEGYNAVYGRSGSTALPPEVTATTWARLLDPQEPMHALLAVDGTRVLGLAHIVFHRNTIMLGMTCYMQDLFTAPAARGRGIGRQLIMAVYDRASRARAPRVYWHTHETNHAARSLYDAVAHCSGFVVYRHEVLRAPSKHAT